MSAFEDFVNLELPKRAVTIRGAVATGDPNASVEPEVVNAPTGTFYLQDEVSPKFLWLRSGVASDSWIGVGSAVSGGFLVGPAGSGAPYTIIQDAVNDAASAAVISGKLQAVLILDGFYEQDIQCKHNVLVTPAFSLTENPEEVREFNVIIRGKISAHSDDAVYESVGPYTFHTIVSLFNSLLIENIDDPAIHAFSDSDAVVLVSAYSCAVRTVGYINAFVGTESTDPLVLIEYAGVDFGYSEFATSDCQVVGFQASGVAAVQMNGSQFFSTLLQGYDSNFACFPYSPSQHAPLVDGENNFVDLSADRVIARSFGQFRVDAGGYFRARNTILGTATEPSILLDNAFAELQERIVFESFASVDVDGTGDLSFVEAWTEYSFGPPIPIRIGAGLTVDSGEPGYTHKPTDVDDWADSDSPPWFVNQALGELAARSTPFVYSNSDACPWDTLQDAVDAASAYAVANSIYQSVAILEGEYTEDVQLKDRVSLVGVPESPRSIAKNKGVVIRGKISAVVSSDADINAWLVNLAITNSGDHALHVSSLTNPWSANVRVYNCSVQTYPLTSQADPLVLVESNVGYAFLDFFECFVVGLQDAGIPAVKCTSENLYHCSLGCEGTVMREAYQDDVSVLIEKSFFSSVTRSSGANTGGTVQFDADSYLILEDTSHSGSGVPALSGAGFVQCIGRVSIERSGAGPGIDGGCTLEAFELEGRNGEIPVIDPSVTFIRAEGHWLFSPTTPSDWGSDPIRVTEALDELAQRSIQGGLWPARPLVGLFDGRMFYDVTLRKPFWYNVGLANWFDANGNPHP